MTPSMKVVRAPMKIHNKLINLVSIFARPPICSLDYFLLGHYLLGIMFFDGDGRDVGP
jgi:hypothetical protein